MSNILKASQMTHGGFSQFPWCLHPSVVQFCAQVCTSAVMCICYTGLGMSCTKDSPGTVPVAALAPPLWCEVESQEPPQTVPFQPCALPKYDKRLLPVAVV